MSKSLEDVLLNIPYVKNKKVDGTLYLLSERLAWMPSGKSSFTISYNYSDIKVQKISPDTKDKIQLQVQLHSSGASTFHFNNLKGREGQLQDREMVKDLLQQMLMKFKKKVNTDLEEKNKLLQDDPELFQLYKTLVVSGVLTADEFWANRVNKIKGFDSASKQEIGVSAAFLADIQGQTDGCNGVRYNLTVDIIESIFKTYPAVERKHAEYVPDKLTEQEFWYQFFQSHYFHRDRINIADKELFADCAKRDELILKYEKEKPLEDPSLDLRRLFDLNYDEGYIQNPDDSKTVGSIPANASLIRRFNQHSSMVLQSCERRSKTQVNSIANGDHFSELNNEQEVSNSTLKAQQIDSSSDNFQQNSSINCTMSNDQTKHFSSTSFNKIQSKPTKNVLNCKLVTKSANNNEIISNSIIKNNFEKISTSNIDSPSLVLDTSFNSIEKNTDLDSLNKRKIKISELEDLESSSSYDKLNKVIPLKLMRSDAYLHGPVPLNAMAYNTGDELFAAAQTFTHDVMSWRSAVTEQIISNQSAISVLWELSPTGSLMQDFSNQQLTDVITRELQSELKAMYIAASELLRHFWACFPATTKELEDKAIRMEACLRRFQKNKFPQFTDRILTHHLAFDLIVHLNSMLEKAFNKFTAWQSKKMNKR